MRTQKIIGLDIKTVKSSPYNTTIDKTESGEHQFFSFQAYSEDFGIDFFSTSPSDIVQLFSRQYGGVKFITANLLFDIEIISKILPSSRFRIERSYEKSKLISAVVRDNYHHCWYFYDVFSMTGQSSLDKIAELIGEKRKPKPEYLDERMPYRWEMPVFEDYVVHDVKMCYGVAKKLYSDYGLLKPTASSMTRAHIKKLKRKLKTAQKIGFDIEPFNNMVVFDLETTGLSSLRHEIIQIAAVRILNGEIQSDDFFFSYVKPKHPISWFISHYTGVTNEHVENAPTPEKILPKFSKYCGDSLIVAHNGLNFDLPFILHTCERYNTGIRAARYIDSMHLSWNVWGRHDVYSHNLDNVIKRLRMSQKGIQRHDARGDVEITARCVCRMMEKLREKNGVELGIYGCVLPRV
ncbi:MAG: 3'-5' exonuclease [Thermoplasmata archaeon]